MKLPKTLLIVLLMLPLMGWAQTVVRYDCTPPPAASAMHAQGLNGPYRLSLYTQWDADRIYRQLVILISFSDTDFQLDNPQAEYDSIFNVKGFNRRKGKGCVADYFREQSNGLLNMQFDVFGPYKVSSKAQPYESPTDRTVNYGREPMTEAAKMLLEENPEMDFSPYDWNGNGQVNQVIYVYAGYCGNESSEKCYGHIWPNTSSFSSVTTPDGKRISSYTCSGELWSNNNTCGIGTICHEFSHSLGLPDLYPVNGWTYSAVDEWDLMDGGNFTNYGWCPPNYSPLEKMLLGWLKPTELTEPATLVNIKPVSQGGEVYQVKHTDTEFLLLENRQWEGWDSGLPGKGLVAYHVNYDASAWRGNTVNNSKNKFNYSLVCADNLTYAEWQNYLVATGATSQYAHSGKMNNLHLSGAPYPYANDTILNWNLTDTSVPAALMYNPDSVGSTLLSKPITHIRQNADGTVSFRFMGGVRLEGDLDDDDQLTMADAVVLVNIIALGGTEEQRKAADVNGDDHVDVADIICLQTMMMHETLPASTTDQTKESY